MTRSPFPSCPSQIVKWRFCMGIALWETRRPNNVEQAFTRTGRASTPLRRWYACPGLSPMPASDEGAAAIPDPAVMPAGPSGPAQPGLITAVAAAITRAGTASMVAVAATPLRRRASATSSQRGRQADRPWSARSWIASLDTLCYMTEWAPAAGWIFGVVPRCIYRICYSSLVDVRWRAAKPGSGGGGMPGRSRGPGSDMRSA
jgi:hypothetical protein